MTDPFDRPARPWDLFNKNLEKVTGDQYDRRMDICLTCEHIIKLNYSSGKKNTIKITKQRLHNYQIIQTEKNVNYRLRSRMSHAVRNQAKQGIGMYYSTVA